MTSGMNGDLAVTQTARSGDRRRTLCPYRTANLLVRQNAAGFVEEDAAEIHLECFGIGGLEQCLFFGDFLFLDQLEKGLIESLHAFVGAGLDSGKKFIEEVLFNEF